MSSPRSPDGGQGDTATMEFSRAPSCQVEGCTASLQNLKDYYLRYKVCEFHSTVEQMVSRDGQLQRFCQQCGRFHPLTAFDGTKRSCRDGLARHNARRRRSSARRPSSMTASPSIGEQTSQDYSADLYGSRAPLWQGGGWDPLCFGSGGGGSSRVPSGGGGCMSSPLQPLMVPTRVAQAPRSMPLLPLHHSLTDPTLGPQTLQLPSLSSGGVNTEMGLPGWQGESARAASLAVPALHQASGPAVMDSFRACSNFQLLNMAQHQQLPNPSCPGLPAGLPGQGLNPGPEMPCGQDDAIGLGSLSGITARRPMSWPTALSKLHAYGDGHFGVQGHNALPFAVPNSFLPDGFTHAQQPVYSPEPVDGAWDLLCPARGGLAGEGQFLGSVFDAWRQPGQSGGAAQQQQQDIYVLGGNQSLETLWQDLQPSPETHVPAAPDPMQGISLTGGNFSGTQAQQAHCSTLVTESSIYDSDFSMTTMLPTLEPSLHLLQDGNYESRS